MWVVCLVLFDPKPSKSPVSPLHFGRLLRKENRKQEEDNTVKIAEAQEAGPGATVVSLASADRLSPLPARPRDILPSGGAPNVGRAKGSNHSLCLCLSLPGKQREGGKRSQVDSLTG